MAAHRGGDDPVLDPRIDDGFLRRTFGFLRAVHPLLAAFGYDRLTTAAMIILGALTGVMGVHRQPLPSVSRPVRRACHSVKGSMRMLLWVILTAMSVGWVLRYAAKIRRTPTRRWLAGPTPTRRDASDTDLAAEHLEHEPEGNDHP